MRKARAESANRRVITWDKVVYTTTGVRYVVTDSEGEYKQEWPDYIDSIGDYLKRFDELWDKGTVV